MGASVTFFCGGCPAEAGPFTARPEFVSLFGGSHGFGSRKALPISALAPEGWVVFDPYTGCTYCPECWASIVGEPEAAALSREGEQERSDGRCSYTWPLPSWMGPEQDSPCRCDLVNGHEGEHSCQHLRSKALGEREQ